VHETVAACIHRALYAPSGGCPPPGSAVSAAWTSAGVVQTVAAGRTSRTATLDGIALPAPGTPIQPSTRFDLASVTKPMATATLLAQAVTAGRVDLALPLQHWLDEARGTALGAAPLWLVGCHASGAVAWLDFALQTRALAADPAARREAICAAVCTQPLQSAAGVQAVYSDLGYMALGWVLERVFDTTLDVAFADNIARPLGLQAGFRPLGRRMPAEAIVATEIWPTRCADGRALSGEVHDDNCAALGGVAGHAGLFASAPDVLQWATCWLRAAQGRPEPLGLAPPLVRRWLATAGAAHTSWRLGWDTPSQPGSSAGQRAPADAFGHLGFTGTSVWLSPAADTAVVLLTNRVHPGREATAAIRALRPAVHDAIWPLPS
jgi:CubicO group peptidase (beta-lactamase class C family)